MSEVFVLFQIKKVSPTFFGPVDKSKFSQETTAWKKSKRLFWEKTSNEEETGEPLRYIASRLRFSAMAEQRQCSVT